jgi:hypothetical protein
VKVDAVCDWCGCVFQKKQIEVRPHNFCCIAHFREWNSRRLSKYNATENPMNEPGGQSLENRLKRHELLRTPGGKTYKKYLGRHEHRVVAEEMLGRSLRPDEVVHHIDGDKTNNSPSNLAVMTRKEHAALHAKLAGFGRKRGGDVHVHVQ